MKMNKTLITMIALIVWGVFSTVYIGWNSWQQFKNGQMVAAFNNGATQGYQQAIVTIATEAEKCQAVPLNTGTDKDGKQLSTEIVAVKCLQQQNADPSTQGKAVEKK